MPEYQVRLRLRSSYVTPFHADTLFGHICWAIVYQEGEDALRELLAVYASQPPLLISDGFPWLTGRSYLPMPLLSPFSPERLAGKIGVDVSNKLAYQQLVAALKLVKKKSFVASRALLELGQKGLTVKRC